MNYIEKYNIKAAQRAYEAHEKVWWVQSPTMSMMPVAAAAGWIQYHIAYIDGYINDRPKLTAEQMDDITNTIYRRFGKRTLAQMCVLFGAIKNERQQLTAKTVIPALYDMLNKFQPSYSPTASSSSADAPTMTATEYIESIGGWDTLSPELKKIFHKAFMS